MQQIRQQIKIGLWLLALAWAIPAQALQGTIQTRSGRIYDGTIQSEPGAFLVAQTNGQARVETKDVARVRFKSAEEQLLGATNVAHGLRGTYFPNPDFTGESVARIDPEIDFDWRQNAPIPGIGPFAFSVRWEGMLQVPASGKFYFYSQSDGLKLWINDELLIDKSEDMAPGDVSGAVQLAPGVPHKIRIEYVCHDTMAAARLFWSGPGIASGIVPSEVWSPLPLDPANGARLPAIGLLATYFAEPDLSGETRVRYDPAIDFDWGEEAPVNGLTPGHFSVRWQGKLLPKCTETFSFQVEAENGVRLWLNGNLILNAWRHEKVTAASIPVRLTAGQKCDFRLEMFSAHGAGSIKLFWSSRSTPLGVIPATQFVPVPAPEHPAEVSAQGALPAGIMLASGSFLTWPLASAESSGVVVNGPQGPLHLSPIHVARIILQPLSPELAVRLVAGRVGLLFKNRDFVQGEFKGVKNGEVLLGSVLFGTKGYAVQEAAALALHDIQQKPVQFVVRLQNGSVLRATTLEIGPQTLACTEPILKQLSVNWQDVLELARE